jgi:hypothetical protein
MFRKGVVDILAVGEEKVVDIRAPQVDQEKTCPIFDHRSGFGGRK